MEWDVIELIPSGPIIQKAKYTYEEACRMNGISEPVLYIFGDSPMEKEDWVRMLLACRKLEDTCTAARLRNIGEGPSD